MTTELTLLLWSVALYGLYLGAQAILFRAIYGVHFAVTARDVPPPPSALVERCERALKNFQETWPVFIVLMLVAQLADAGDAVVFWGALVWLVARLAYLPLYLFGVVWVRSLVWLVALGGLAIIFFGLLF